MRVLLVVLLLAAVAGLFFTLLGREDSESRGRLETLAQHERSAVDREWGDRQSVDRVTEQLSRLAASMDRLSRQLEEWRAAPESRFTPGPEAVASGTSGSPAIDAGRLRAARAAPAVNGASDPVRRQRFGELSGQAWLDVTRRHWFWTFEETLERYGPPDQIHPQEGGRVDFIYNVGSEEYRLQFYDGRLLVVN